MDYSNINLVKTELYKYNIQNINLLNHKDSIVKLLNIKSKLIEKKKYNIKTSNILSKKIPTLSAQLKKDLHIIKETLSKGKDINPFLSKLVLEPNYYDKLFLDWEIKHLHINATPDENSYFNKRSDYLLIVMLDKNNIYFIDIQHHQWEDIFTNIEYLKIIKRNWKELLAPHIVLNRVCIEEDKLTNKELHEIRRNNFNVPICLDGELYMNINGGITGAGINFEIETFANNIIKNIEKKRYE